MGHDGTVTVRVTPGASHPRVQASGGTISVYVSEPPEDDTTNAAVAAALASAFGVPKANLELIRGGTARERVFRVK